MLWQTCVTLQGRFRPHSAVSTPAAAGLYSEMRGQLLHTYTPTPLQCRLPALGVSGVWLNGGGFAFSRRPVIGGAAEGRFRHIGGVTPVGVRRGVQHAALLHRLLLRFLTQFLGGMVCVVLSRNLQRRLTNAELAFLWVQGHRIFARMPATSFHARRVDTYPWRYGALALYLSVAVRDTSLLVMWLQNRVRTMTLFQHRRFFRTLALTLQTAVVAPAQRYELAGMRMSVIGKISVTGNAMSRSYAVRAGLQGNATLGLRHVQSFTIIRTRTGCLGVTLGFYF